MLTAFASLQLELETELHLRLQDPMQPQGGQNKSQQSRDRS